MCAAALRRLRVGLAGCVASSVLIEKHHAKHVIYCSMFSALTAPWGGADGAPVCVPRVVLWLCETARRRVETPDQGETQSHLPGLLRQNGHETVSDLDIPRWIWIQQIRRQLLERRACTGTWKPLRPRDVHLPDTRPQSRISRAVMPPTVSARSLAEANLFSRMRPRAAVGQCDRTVRMPAPCPSHVRAVHTTIARFGPPPKFPTFLH